LLQYERIKLLQELKGANAALQILSELVTEYPDDARILTSLANSQADLGDLPAATQTALAALKAGKLGLEPHELANIHYLTGSLLRKSGQLDQAVQHLSEAVSLSTQFLEAYLELGLARKERREYHQALQAFEQATKIAPRDPRPHYQAGLALKEGKDFQRSEAMLRQAANLAPDDVLVRRQLAQVVALNLVHHPRT
jgi:tetratricopeptide (TPR) repeat protein